MKTLNLVSKNSSTYVNVKEEDIDKSYFEHINNAYLINATNSQIERRNDGEFKDKALFLSASYDYILGKDMGGLTILVPIKKG